MPTKRRRIVVLDGQTLNPGDLSWNKLKALGYTIIYNHTSPDAIIQRSDSADIILVNKVVLDQTVLQQLPQLKCICVTATGYNNIDLETAKNQGIVVCNAVGYSTESVAQHVLAMIMYFTNQIGQHHASVLIGQWEASRDFTYQLNTLSELAGKTIGIYGFGRIGRQVAKLAHAFDMQVLATHKHPERDAQPGVEFVSLEQLFAASDFVTLHAPLTNKNKGIVNEALLKQMKPTSYLINTGRGPLINELDLKNALENNVLAGAALDVLSAEPPSQGNPLIGAPNCVITPHIAWATLESRQRLMDIVVENVRSFLVGKPKNVV